MYGFKYENTDLPYNKEHEGKEVRVVTVWYDSTTEHSYRLYKPYKSFFKATVWVERAETNDKIKAQRWADHYGVVIEP